MYTDNTSLSIDTMVKILKHLVGNIILSAIILYVASEYVPSLGFVVQWSEQVLVSFAVLGTVFRIMNGIIKKILLTITFPLKYLTLWLSSLLINVWILYAFAYVINSNSRGVSVQLWTLIQTVILSVCLTAAYFILKQIL
jgi:uncharacterized membrane protein YvlD (DUF360 family)